MPRAKSHNKQPRSKGQDPVECITFRFWTSAANAATTLAAPTISTVPLVPGLDTRLSGIAEFYQWFRFTKVKVTLFPHTNASPLSASCNVSVGYIPRTPNSAPTTHGEIMTLPASKYLSSLTNQPQQLNVPKSVLLGDAPIKWFQTKVGTEDTQWETQGVLYYGSSSVGTNTVTEFVIMTEGVCEFKGRSSSNQTPMFLQPKNPAIKNWADEVIKSEKAQDDVSNLDTVTIGGYVYRKQ
jgi:hypothetical protein